jgi:tetratricopeptide (TPR) repeat protein
MPPEGKYKLAPYLLLSVVTVLLYANALSGGFVWDDNLFTANQVYWGFDLGKIFFSLANGLEYLPVRDLSYLFDIALWKGTPFGFHLTNLLLFVAIVILVYGLANRLTHFTRSADSSAPQWFVPLFTALVFAVHPLKSEVVAWITQRNTLLATLFFLISVSCFLRYREKEENKTLAVSLAVFILAILSKAIVVVLPLLLLFFMLLEKGSAWRQGKFWAPLVPFIVLAGAGAALHIAIARKTTVISVAYYGSFSERLAVAVQIPFFYLKKTLLPTDLSAFYTENFAQSLASPGVLLAAFVLAAVAALAWLLRKKFPEILIGGGWFMITLLPVSNLLATSPVAADRYLFLPSFGLAFTAAALVSRIRLQPKLVVSPILLILCLLAALTFKQNRLWHDDISLWRQTAAISPQVAGVWFNLGRALHRTPQLSLALEAYLRACRLDPANMKSLDNAASLFPSSRGSIAARHELVKSLAEQLPPYPAGLALIGYTEREWQHPDAAEELFLYLLSADRQSVTLQLALANLYRKLGAFDRAIPLYVEIAGSDKGRGEAEFGLAAIAAAKGNQQEKGRLLALAKEKGGVPLEMISKMK